LFEGDAGKCRLLQKLIGEMSNKKRAGWKSCPVLNPISYEKPDI